MRILEELRLLELFASCLAEDDHYGFRAEEPHMVIEADYGY